MKEQDRLTNQARNPRLELGRNSMPNESPPSERDLTPETAADRVERAAGEREAEANFRNFVNSLTPEVREALRKELLKEEGVEQELPRMEGVPRGILTSREARDKFFTSLFSVVDSKPHEFFERAFNPLIQGVQLDTFTRILQEATRIKPGDKIHGISLDAEQIKQIKEDLDRYEAERRIREFLHNVNAILYLPSVKAEQLFDNMQQFESLLGDVALSTPGATEMMNIYEETLREEMMQNDGYLKPEAITGKVKKETEFRKENGVIVKDSQGKEVVDTILVQVNKEGSVEDQTKKRFRDYIDKFGLTARDEKGQIVTITRKMEEWELDRTFITARAMMIMSGRLLSIAAEGRLGEGLGKYQSLFLQDILQAYSPYIHLLGKYGITESGLAAYLHKPDDEGKKFLGMLKTWDPAEYQRVMDKYSGNELAILESADEFFYIMRQNPNRAGDAFTWQSWRYPTDVEEPGSLKDFITEGRERMWARWDNIMLKKYPGVPKAEVYEKFIKQEKYHIPRNASPDERKKIKDMLSKDWGNANRSSPSIEDYERFANEYVNWIGTAIRFEKLRGTLQYIKPGQKMDHGQERAFSQATKILGRMVDLQPHRLYLKSQDIRERVNRALGIPAKHEFQTKEQQNMVDRVIKNLYALEGRLLRERERLLDEGKTFADVSLDEFLRGDGVIKSESEKEEVRKFMAVFQADLKNNGNLYLNEFIYRREYKHGFVLWTGDAPLDEFKFSALGPTGSFVRRARDNKYQIEAWGEEVKLLNSLKDIQTPDDMIKALRAVYDKIALYSPDRAKESIVEKAEGLIKFFMQRSTTKIPFWGAAERLFGDDISFAKMVYGKSAPAWSTTEVRYLVEQLKDKKLIHEDSRGYEKLKKNVAAGNLELGVDAGVTFAQLLVLWYILHLLRNSMKEK